MKKIEVDFDFVEHRNMRIILVRFERNKAVSDRLQEIADGKWSRTYQCWYTLDTEENRKKLRIVPKRKYSENNAQQLALMQDRIILKGLSKNTLRTYSNEFKLFLADLGEEVKAQDCGVKDIEAYLLMCAKERNLSEFTLHSRINAIKFYYEQVLLKAKIDIEITRPKKPSILPKAINAKDIKHLLDVTTNLKHNTMLKLCYGMGLRVSEIVNLKISDIDIHSKQAFIERAKGKKDRYVNVPESIFDQLTEYYKQFAPKKYVFEGQGGTQYSARSAQQVFKQAMKKANINKEVGIHALRHSYATHLLEEGTDIGLIQQLLGHNNIKTTLIYAKVSRRVLQNVRSPLDNL